MMPLYRLAFLIAVGLSARSPAYSATMDEHITCTLVYGALFQAAKNSQHEGMIAYARPRLQAILPYIQANKDNPQAKAKLREIATRLEDEVKNKFVRQATIAIQDGDVERLKSSMSRVFQCDRAFGLASLPLPFAEKQEPRWNGFLQGFNSGCLAKQRRANSPFSDAQIQTYCRCMTDKQAANGVDSSSSEETTGRIISASHGYCLSSIQ